ncbi:MAG TPA: ABC transporter ATP-binding protein [Dehalococcoidia bacterium]|nr:ABC transporter ATP-binding protein [Dehalococcoidia bacterium]
MTPRRGPDAGADVLVATGLRKRYGHGDSAVDALRGVDIAIAAGEIVAIMGPSGCGKTTLLHVLGGIEPPDDGAITIDGTPLSRSEGQLATLHRRTVTFVFQGFGLISSLSARENVEFPLVAAGVPAGERHRAALAALADVGLVDWQNHLPEELSGGQRQRVAIARALVPGPRVILADEPTGNLDVATGEEVLDLLITSARSKGSALVMVTHDPDAGARADRILSLRDGLLVHNTEDLA